MLTLKAGITLLTAWTAVLSWQRLVLSNNINSTIDSSRIVWVAYTISPGEGFNLHRDVYIRAATMVNHLRQSSPHIDVRLVLYPWLRLPHWKNAPSHHQVPWSTFFNVTSLNDYVPVIELAELQSVYSERIAGTSAAPAVDVIVELLPVARDGGWDFAHEEGYKLIPCPATVANRYQNVTIGTLPNGSNLIYNVMVQNANKYFSGIIPTQQARQLQCASAQGKATILESLVSQQPNGTIILFASFERLLHHQYGSPDYWKCRQSMQYASNLIEIADRVFAYLFSPASAQSSSMGATTDNKHEQQMMTTKPYVSLHVRRGEFATHRRGGSLDDVCRQLNALLAVHDKNLTKEIEMVFVANDELETVSNFLRNCLTSRSNLHLVSLRDAPSFTIHLSDGELAIVDQIVAARASIFIGTCDSTFTLRIQEDRELLGGQHAPNTTFNCFCNKEEQIMRDDYGIWTRNGPCYIKRPWRWARNETDYFRVAFEQNQYVHSSYALTGRDVDEGAARLGDEL